MPHPAPIVYLTRLHPPVYRVAVLETLNERLEGRLVVCSGDPRHGSSLRSIVQQQGAYSHHTLPTYWLGDKVHAHAWPQAFRRFGRPSVVLAEEAVRSVTWPLLVYYCRLRGIPLVSWGHFSSNNRLFDPRQNRADRVRLHMAKQATACLGYTEGVTALLRPYLAHERLFTATNTLDVGRLLELHTQLRQSSKADLRSRLGLRDAPTLVFMGRLIGSKGVAMLLDVYAALQATHASAQLLVIGDGPEKAAMMARVEREAWTGVRFTGALTAWEASAPYLAASDVLVIPGYLGLAINHGFAFGLPVVSQASPGPMRYHSPEIEYVVPGQNGELTPHGDVAAMTDGIRAVLQDQDRYSAAALRYARTHLTMDRMVDGLYNALTYAEHASSSDRN
ncbi:MAG: glycosyltransferase [Bacteroidota bacterium]